MSSKLNERKNITKVATSGILFWNTNQAKVNVTKESYAFKSSQFSAASSSWFGNNTYNEIIISMNKTSFKKEFANSVDLSSTVIQKTNHNICNEFEIRLYIYTHTHSNKSPFKKSQFITFSINKIFK